MMIICSAPFTNRIVHQWFESFTSRTVHQTGHLFPQCFASLLWPWITYSKFCTHMVYDVANKRGNEGLLTYIGDSHHCTPTKYRESHHCIWTIKSRKPSFCIPTTKKTKKNKVELDNLKLAMELTSQRQVGGFLEKIRSVVRDEMQHSLIIWGLARQGEK